MALLFRPILLIDNEAAAAAAVGDIIDKAFSHKGYQSGTVMQMRIILQV